MRGLAQPPMSDVCCVQQANAILGESPCWDAAQGVLYWVDGKRPAVLRWDPTRGQTGLWPLQNTVGCIATTVAGRLIMADADGIAILDPTSGEHGRIVGLDGAAPRCPFNDGKVDRMGRFWAGTMDNAGIHPTGSLYRLDHDLSLHRLATGFICSNGLGWSPDNKTMYFTDSMVRTIWAYEFDVNTGQLGARRTFAQLAEIDGLPDGLTVDSEGFVWSAVWDGWRVIRFAPDGSVDHEVRMPVQRPTSCAFGGPDHKTLYITSACDDLPWSAIKDGPLAGGLFTIQTHVAGLPERKFGA